MPKKIKRTKPTHRPRTKADKDFFFFVTVSVFAALTIFAASYLNTARQEAIRASQNPASFDLAPLDVTAPDDF
jgi:hypothetical protein